MIYDASRMTVLFIQIVYSELKNLCSVFSLSFSLLLSVSPTLRFSAVCLIPIFFFGVGRGGGVNLIYKSFEFDQIDCFGSEIVRLRA